jgi:ABC-type branched-subunit amino acid transport system substrate-binding protein
VIDGTFRQQLKAALDRDRRRWRIWRRRVVAAALVGLLVLLVGFVWQYRYSCDSKAGLFRTGLTGRCFGITDGWHVFAENIRGIEDRILTENRRVEGLGNYVTVAFYTPMAPERGDTTSPDSVVHDLEGAYLAQREANKNGAPPSIRLVLADPGHRAEQWPQVARRLEGMTGGKDNLVAVTGLGNSTEETRRLVEELSRNQIPMVGSVITSTELNGSKYHGLIRVAPNNEDEVKAAINHLSKTAPEARTALLVQDQNTADNYVTDLGRSFSKHWPDRTLSSLVDVEYYNSGQGSAVGRLAQIAATICGWAPKPDVVYFAGRGILLGELVRALGKRACTVTVVTGDDATQIGQDPDGGIHAALKSGVQVLYTALAHPKMQFDSKDRGAAVDCGIFEEASKTDLGDLYRPNQFDDGQLIMGYDAVTTAVAAIRAATLPKQEAPIPTTSEVLQAFKGLHGKMGQVQGACGPIAINQDTGNPINRPVPIVQLRPDDTTAFVELAWPDGHPPTTPR